MKLNVIKTEYCEFLKHQSTLDLNIEILIENTILKRTRNPKLLGVTLDEKMTFQDHVNAVELKAQKMLSALGILGKRERIEPANIVGLYKSLSMLHRCGSQESTKY